jgi:malate synthase
MPLSHETFNEQVASFANDVEDVLSALQADDVSVNTNLAAPGTTRRPFTHIYSTIRRRPQRRHGRARDMGGVRAQPGSNVVPLWD